MKKLLTLVVLILMVAVVACAPQQPADTTPETTDTTALPAEPADTDVVVAPADDAVVVAPTDEETPPAPAAEPAETTQPVETTQPTTTPPTTQPAAETSGMDPDVQNLISVADIKVKSYSYHYTEPPLNAGGDQFFVKGTKMRIDLIQSDITLRKPYNAVFLDTQTRQAIGYCIGDEVRCPEGELKFDANYNEYVRETPYQWLKKITGGEITGSVTIEGRTAQIVQYEKDGKIYRQYIEEYYGLPMKVVIEENEEEITYDFRDLDINGVTDEYVTPPDGYE